jgi:diaminopimelate decarboxylase
MLLLINQERTKTMTDKKVPFSKGQIEEIVKKYPTPFHIYDEEAIRENAKKFISAFSWAVFKEYFAVKATPNPYILKIMREIGFGADCSSLPELVLADKSGITGENIMFSSNETPATEYVKAKELGAIINLDDITHIPFLEKAIGIPEVISFRYNPGPLRKGNPIIGDPVESKYGFTRPQIFEGFKTVREKGAKRFGIHSFVISNELNRASYVETARMLFDLAVDLKKELGIRLEFINLSGGIGIPYRPDQDAVDLAALGKEVEQEYKKIVVPNDLHPLKIYTECGRVITGPYGYLVTRAIHRKDIYKNYIGVDACAANLMRPAMYGAYHHITVMGKENSPAGYMYDVVGSLCENNDKFAINRQLPEIETGDILVIHDTGAHGFAMGYNYNGKLRSAELLLKPDGAVEMIRRPETIDDYFATLDFLGL